MFTSKKVSVRLLCRQDVEVGAVEIIGEQKQQELIARAAMLGMEYDDYIRGLEIPLKGHKNSVTSKEQLSYLISMLPVNIISIIEGTFQLSENNKLEGWRSGGEQLAQIKGYVLSRLGGLDI